MDRSVNVAILLILLCLSCCSGSPTTPTAAETSNEENLPCYKEMKEKFKNLFNDLIAGSEKLLVVPRERSSRILSDRLKIKLSSSTESSSESLESRPDNVAQQIFDLLGKIDLVMQNFNRTISSSSCFKHFHQPMNQAASHIAKLQKQTSFSCETSPLICFVFRVLHWMYVEPTYELLLLFRDWINTKSFNSGTI
ncbi:uncharacterized protein LOC126567121 [Anopheles maculipalpis]|uniref:uncharacterized protein LOC126567121 n=1 Tax=Anopheles maculipalpis TaxID=1496333 RepID=UPI0021592DB0|nr:uncharacterized protein LOC126567121 [Anopheles maculipalpis]